MPFLRLVLRLGKHKHPGTNGPARKSISAADRAMFLAAIAATAALCALLAIRVTPIGGSLG